MGKSRFAVILAAVLFAAAGALYCTGIYEEGTAKVFQTSDESSVDIVRATSFEEAIELAEAPVIVNINTAGVGELTLLPGIGEAKAQKIIEYRNEQGSFADIADIMRVPGIKEGVFEKIRDFICVENMP